MNKITSLVSLALLANINTTLADYPVHQGSDNQSSRVQNQAISALEEEILWLKEETFVSTATKTLEDISKSGATVSVITAADLKNMGARNLMDALKRIPGLGISTNNVGMPSIEVRGVRTDYSEKVLFLINGHATNNNLVNGGALSSYHNFIIDDIKRVEIVRGPGSALYGANAFVAVINIITKSSSDINGTEVTLGTGSYKTKKLNIQFGNQFDQLELASNLNIYDTEGFKGDVESDAILQSGKTNFWHQRYDFGFNMNYDDLSLNGKYLKRQSGPYLGANSALNDDSEQEYIEYFLEFGYDHAIASHVNFSTKLYLDHFQFDNLWEIFPEGFTDAGGTTYAEGLLLRSPIEHEKLGVEFQIDYQLSNQHKLLLGLMAEHQSQYNVELWTNGGSGPLQNISAVANWNGSHNRDIHAFYAQDIWDANDELRVILGARYDHYDDFGDTLNPRASLTWEMIENYNLIATYGSAFRAPTFGELYNINNPSILGNPDVQPEEIETYELAITGEINKKTSFRVTGFHNNITDLIDDTPSAAAVIVSGNVGKLKVYGIEAELNSRLSGGSTFAINGTFQNPKNDLTKERAPNISRQKFNASFNYRHSRYLAAYAGLSHQGELTRSSGDPRPKVSSHTTLDLAVNLKDISDHWDITASIYNFFDKVYVDASPFGVMNSDYPKPGRSFMLEAIYKL